MLENKRLLRGNQDYLMSFVRSQIMALEKLLSNIENTQKFDNVYFKESIFRIERDMYKFRKVIW